MGLLTKPMYHWKYDIMNKEQWGDGNATETAHGNDRRFGPRGTFFEKTGSQAVDDTMKQEYAVWMDIIDCVISSVN